jgi:hypothetical protein
MLPRSCRTRCFLLLVVLCTAGMLVWLAKLTTQPRRARLFDLADSLPHHITTPSPTLEWVNKCGPTVFYAPQRITQAYRQHYDACALPALVGPILFLCLWASLKICDFLFGTQDIDNARYIAHISALALPMTHYTKDSQTQPKVVCVWGGSVHSHTVSAAAELFLECGPETLQVHVFTGAPSSPTATSDFAAASTSAPHELSGRFARRFFVVDEPLALGLGAFVTASPARKCDVLYMASDQPASPTSSSTPASGSASSPSSAAPLMPEPYRALHDFLHSQAVHCRTLVLTSPFLSTDAMEDAWYAAAGTAETAFDPRSTAPATALAAPPPLPDSVLLTDAECHREATYRPPLPLPCQFARETVQRTFCSARFKHAVTC